MPLPPTDLVGYLAAALTTCSFIPQAWLTFRTRDVRGVSLGMYTAFTMGIALWLLYGLLLSAWPIVVANAITLALAAAILLMKLRYGRDGQGGSRLIPPKAGTWWRR
jgi:MtN3 and saliva related transmembrane protein